jgi:hypothetical protein
MPLAPAEVVLGAIAYFDADVLNGDDSVVKPESPVSRPGVGAGNQFVCYKLDGDKAFWAPLTATYRRERLHVEPKWVANGYGPLVRGGVYLQDGRTTYAGPVEAFVKAASAERPFHGRGGGPSISNEGLAEIVRVVGERGGQL